MGLLDQMLVDYLDRDVVVTIEPADDREAMRFYLYGRLSRSRDGDGVVLKAGDDTTAIMHIDEESATEIDWNRSFDNPMPNDLGDDYIGFEAGGNLITVGLIGSSGDDE